MCCICVCLKERPLETNPNTISNGKLNLHAAQKGLSCGSSFLAAKIPKQNPSITFPQYDWMSLRPQCEKPVIDLCMTGKQSHGWMAAFTFVGSAVKPRRPFLMFAKCFRLDLFLNWNSFKAYSLSK